MNTIKIALLLAVCAVAPACSAVKPACAVVDVAHAACEYVTVEYIDDDGNVQRERVPRSELRAAAMRAKAARQ